MSGPTSALPHTPFDRVRPWLYGRFEDGSGYLFNLNRPSGVYYIDPRGMERVVDVFNRLGNPPRASGGDVQRSGPDADIVRVLEERGRQASPKPQPSPFEAWLHVVNACNLACKHCYIPDLQKSVAVAKEGSLARIETLTTLVDELVALCKANAHDTLRLKFSGGEPALAIDLLASVCAYAERRCGEEGLALQLGVLTNATIIEERFLELLDRYRIHVSVSVDGHRASHDAIRFRLPSERRGGARRLGTWDEVLANMALFQRRGLSVFGRVTMTKANYEEMPDLVRVFLGMGAPFSIHPVRDRAAFRSTEAEHASILRSLERAYTYAALELPVKASMVSRARFADWSLFSPQVTPCGACNNYIAVSEAGDVATCQMRLERSFGNVTETPLIDIMKKIRGSSELRRFTDPMSVTGGCRACAYRLVCAGGCPEHTRMVADTYDSPSPWCRLFGDFLPIYVRLVALHASRYFCSGDSTYAGPSGADLAPSAS